MPFPENEYIKKLLLSISNSASPTDPDTVFVMKVINLENTLEYITKEVHEFNQSKRMADKVIRDAISKAYGNNSPINASDRQQLMTSLMLHKSETEDAVEKLFYNSRLKTLSELSYVIDGETNPRYQKIIDAELEQYIRVLYFTMHGRGPHGDDQIVASANPHKNPRHTLKHLFRVSQLDGICPFHPDNQEYCRDLFYKSWEEYLEQGEFKSAYLL